MFSGFTLPTFAAMNTIILSRIKYQEDSRIKLDFIYNSELIGITRTIPGARWSVSMKCWHIPDNKGTIVDLLTLFRNKAWIDYEQLKIGNIEIKSSNSRQNTRIKPILNELTEEKKNKIQKFKYWLRSKRYSESTIATYTDALKTFLRFYINKPINEITNEDVIEFNNKYIFENKYSVTFQNQVVNALKLFFRTVENKTIVVEAIHRPKRPKLLPNVLSKEEVKLILDAPVNLKHKAMLSLIYSCGLRCGELLNLKPEHIDSKRGLVIVKQAKGRKDRIIPLSIKILELLRNYYKTCKPINYLFEGQTKGKKYDERSLQQVLKQSLIKAEITKPVTLHWLRHSYATHLLENGTDLRYIQELLGHSRSTTTEIYTHVSNKQLQRIRSPFDTL